MSAVVALQHPDSGPEESSSSSRAHAIEAAVLSILATWPEALDSVAHRLKPAHFAVPLHRRIFAELVRASSRPDGIDVLTMAEALQEPPQRIHEVLTCHDHTSRGLGALVDWLIERYLQRELARLASTLAKAAFDPSRPAKDRIDAAMTELLRLDAEQASDDWVDAPRSVEEHIELVQQRCEGAAPALPTGLAGLDRMLDGGLQRGNLVVIGARPAMGKTALALTLALHLSQQHHVGLLSLEMSHAEIRDRAFAQLGALPLAALRRPQQHALDSARLLQAAEQLRQRQLHISDKAGLTILSLRAKARHLKRRSGLDVLIVDYLGLMEGLDRKQTRAYQIEEITKGMKALAKELDIVVLALAQVNRAAAERLQAIPGLHDLRDSGSIEQDADVVGFLHRPIVLNPQAGAEYESYALLRIAKNRQGRTGDVHLCYEGATTRFADWCGSPPGLSVRPRLKDAAPHYSDAY